MIDQEAVRPPDGSGSGDEWKGEERRNRLRRRTDGQDGQRHLPAPETLAIARRDWARGTYLLG